MKRPSGIEILVIIGIAALLVSIVLPAFTRMRETAGRQRCPSNLRQIGQAMLLYAHDFGGGYPDRLESLAVTQDITGEVFVCPGTDDKAVVIGPTTQQTLASFASGKHISYAYLRPPISFDGVGPDDIVAYDPPTNHPGEGSYLLYGDGHVNWEPADVVQRLVAATKAKWQAAATQPATRAGQ